MLTNSKTSLKFSPIMKNSNTLEKIGFVLATVSFLILLLFHFWENNPFPSVLINRVSELFTIIGVFIMLWGYTKRKNKEKKTG